MTTPIRFVASVAERDVDFVLLEELSVNDEFCDWFATRCFERPVFRSRNQTLHSVSESVLGESDLEFIFESDDAGILAVLIENKISAVPQPEQAQRYVKRGENGKRDQKWNDFQTCLVAPKKYLNAGNSAAEYNVNISYEEILAFFVSRRRRDERYAFKARLVREAIEQNRRGFQQVVSKEMTEFAKAYVADAKSRYPSCGVVEAKDRAAGNTWLSFRPAVLRPGVTIEHQLTAGFAKLFFANAAADIDHYRTVLKPFLPADVEPAVTGKSVQVSIAVPKIDPVARTFADQEVDARKGMDAVHQLIELYQQAKATI